MNGVSRFLKVTLKVCIPVFAAVSLSAQGVNKYIPVSKHVSNDNGITWPYGQVIPHFAMPADTLDALDIQEGISDDEKLMFTVLQGLVNKTHPRLFLFQPAGEGKYKWPEKLGLCMDELPRAKRFELVRKYAAELDGVVLYDPSKNIHYANLASTVAGIENLLPVTQPLHQLLLNEGIKLPVRTDLTRLNFTRTTQIYDYLYKYYWKRCTHRLLVSQPPERGFVRDLAVASGAAIVWLDARKWNENVILRKFLKEMKPGESLVTGWFPEERSGVGMTAEYGLSTIPSDFYMNATVYAGMSQPVHYPKVPKMPELENKIYLALFLSDGDNVQYCQHAMSQLWDKEGRGSIPINWTISPGLVDFGPALLNYYYDTATENDCFASGPSGLGYSLIYDSHNYIWNSDSGEAISPYVKWTQQYLEKSGLRIITIWDEINDEQRSAYARYCRYLYGLTLQDWEHQPYKLPTLVQDRNLPVIANLPCYANGVDVIYSFWQDTIAKFDGSKPLFLSAQGESWKMGPDNIVALKERLEALSLGNIVICRGDHFFNLYRKANGLPFNLTLSPNVTVKTSLSKTSSDLVADGSAAEKQMWVSGTDDGKAWIQFDFKKKYLISRYVVRHAGNAGLPDSLNTRDFKLEVSNDGKKWESADCQSGNTMPVTDVDIVPVKARYIRLSITDSGEDQRARIADIEIYGSVL